MRDYLKILIAVTIITFVAILIVNLFFGQQIQVFIAAAAALLSGLVLAFVLQKV